MKIDTFKAYSDVLYPKVGTNKVSDGNSLPQKQNAELKTGKENNNGSVLTQNERDFFIKMFPQNSEQIQNHVVFNRNGKLQSSNTSKGLIIDGRV